MSERHCEEGDDKLARVLTNTRIATSFYTHEAGSTQGGQEVDFDLGTNQAIEIFSVFGVVDSLENITAVATLQAPSVQHSLHLEDDNPRDTGLEITDTDLVELNDEVIYKQSVVSVQAHDTTNGVGSAGLAITPTGMVTYPEPILTAANLQHQFKASGTNMDIAATLYIFYRYVLLSNQELAGIIAVRR